MKKIAIVFCVFIMIGWLAAQDSFEDFRRNQQAEQSSYRNNQEEQFNKFHAEQDSLFIQYKEAIERLWNEFKESTPKDWVSYNEDFTSRSEVSFDTGEIAVEAVVESDSAEDEVTAKEKVKQQIIEILKEEDSTGEAILSDQVKNPVSGKNPVKESEIEEVAEIIVEKAVKSEIKGADSQNRVKFSIKLELMPNHISKRAEKYKPMIERYCQLYNIEPKLVLSIVHTESYFNPKAYNRHGNAYGMMQIVPKYAGLTMNKHLFNKNSKPTSRDLFDPGKNLQMGTAYLRWLADNNWKEVTNKQNQIYCMICSYNGGAGSVYKAMTGKTRNLGPKYDKMITDLSTMDSNSLFNKLSRDIPYEETRNYIKKVTELMNKEYINQ